MGSADELGEVADVEELVAELGAEELVEATSLDDGTAAATEDAELISELTGLTTAISPVELVTVGGAELLDDVEPVEPVAAAGVEEPQAAAPASRAGTTTTPVRSRADLDRGDIF